MSREACFAEFARLKLAADGSDSYIMGAVELALEQLDPLWYLCVWSTFYAPPAQEVFCDYWTRRDLLIQPEKVRAWIKFHRKALPLSGARITNGMGIDKMMKVLTGCAKLLEEGWPYTAKFDDFPSAFKSVIGPAPEHGRYIGLKLYEAMRRVGVPLPVVSDIRASGGKTPRQGLQILYGHDPKPGNREACTEANALAEHLRKQVPTTMFNVEMLLCNFTKAVKGSYYPGHALDRELSRIIQVQAEWGPVAGSATLRIRRQLYDPGCLGEVSGWSGTRKALERCYPDRGYLWSDLRYVYHPHVNLDHPPQHSSRIPAPLQGYGEENP